MNVSEAKALVLNSPAKKLFRDELVLCNYCNAQGHKLLRCSRCKAIYYCNADCQAKDWERHKVYCDPESVGIKRIVRDLRVTIFSMLNITKELDLSSPWVLAQAKTNEPGKVRIGTGDDKAAMDLIRQFTLSKEKEAEILKLSQYRGLNLIVEVTRINGNRSLCVSFIPKLTEEEQLNYFGKVF